MANVTTESSKRIPAHAEQCFLVENIDSFTLKKGTDLTQDYSHIGLVDPSESDSIILLNKIRGMGQEGQSLFENMPKSIAGDLQPYVKLYKIVPFKAGQSNAFKDIAVHLPFNNLNFDPTQITSSGTNKKLGVAFRSFSFDFEGKRPVEVDAYVRCSLRLYFESPDALMHRYGTSPKSVAFSDLIARPFITKNVTSHDHLEYDDKYFRIKMVIGYIPPSYERLIEAYRSSKVNDPAAKALELITALRNSKFELFLTLTKHTVIPRFDSPDGGYELSIEYIGSIETTFRSKNADVLAHPADKIVAAEHREWELTLARKRQEAFSGISSVRRAEIEAIAGAGDFSEEVEREFQSRKDVLLEDDLRDPRERMAEQAHQGTVGLREIQEEVLTRRLNAKLARGHMGKVIGYLKWRDDFEMYKDKSGMKTVHLSDIYSRIVTKLNERSRLYVTTLRNQDFENWFLYFDRTKRNDMETNQKKLDEINKKIKKAKTNEQKRPLIHERETLELLIQDRSSQDRMYANIQKRAAENITTASAGGEAASRSAAAVTAELEERRRATEETEEAANRDEEPTTADADAKKTVPTPIENRDIFYFYYGDLLDTVLEVMSEMKKFLDLNFWSATNKKGNVKMLLGEIEFPHPKTGVRVKENLARIPITLDTWQRFWIDKVISPLKTEYLLRSFLHDTLSELIVAAMTNKCKRLGSPQLVVRTGIHYETLNNNMQMKFKQKKRAGRLDKAYYHSLTIEPMIGDLDDEADNEKEAVKTELIYIHAPSSSSRWFDPKNKKQDLGRGVHHIVLGAENSPIIAVSLEKSNQPYYLETKAETGGALDDTVHFSEPYNCSITMYGNSIILPGKHLHISFPHSHFGKPYNKNSAARRLGLGGYFFILKTGNEIKASESRLDWTTQLQCRWESFGNESKVPTAMYTPEIEPEKPTNELALEGESVEDFNKRSGATYGENQEKLEKQREAAIAGGDTTARTDHFLNALIAQRVAKKELKDYEQHLDDTRKASYIPFKDKESWFVTDLYHSGVSDKEAVSVRALRRRVEKAVAAKEAADRVYAGKK